MNQLIQLRAARLSTQGIERLTPCVFGVYGQNRVSNIGAQETDEPGICRDVVLNDVLL